MAIAGRLKIIRHALKLKQWEFAEKIEIPAPTYSELETGKYKPNCDFLEKISRNCHVNLYYLLFGEGEMFGGHCDNCDIKLPGEILVRKEVIRNFLWYFERSPIVQLLVLGQFQSILKNEKNAIAREIEEYNESQKNDVE
jgi:transcriptional regulator with XRE-family HTH domain